MWHKFFFQLEGYQLTKRLFKNSKTWIYRGIPDGQSQAVVLKIHRKKNPTPKVRKEFEREFHILKTLEPVSPEVVRAYDLKYSGKYLFLVLEECVGMNFAQFLPRNKLAYTEFREIALSITRTLHAVHKTGYVHMDINPANLIWDQENHRVRLLDFGNSVPCGQAETNSEQNFVQGTLEYMAPEQTLAEGVRLDARSDLYSLGVTFYRMLAGHPPFTGPNPHVVMHLHRSTLPPELRLKAPKLPQDLYEIVHKLLAKKPENRYQSAKELLLALESIPCKIE